MNDLIDVKDVAVEESAMPTPCAYCGELLADSFVGLRAHYEQYHPETKPSEYVAEVCPEEMEAYRRRELRRRMEQKKGIWHFFGKDGYR